MMSIEYVLSAVTYVASESQAKMAPLNKLLLVELARRANYLGHFEVDLEAFAAHLWVDDSFAHGLLLELEEQGLVELRRETRPIGHGMAIEVLAAGRLYLPALSWGLEGGAA